MARAATARDEARSSNHATEVKFRLISVDVAIPIPRRDAQRDVDPKTLAIFREKVKKEAADAISKLGPSRTLLWAISFALEHASFAVPSTKSGKWMLPTARRSLPPMPQWSVASFTAWTLVLLDEWIVQADNIIADVKHHRDVDAIKAVDEVTTFAGRGGFAHEVALQFAEFVRDEIMEALADQPAVRRDSVLQADMKAAGTFRANLFGGAVESKSDDIIARLFNKATQATLTMHRPPGGFPSDEEFEMLDAKLDATMAKLPRPQRNKPPEGPSKVHDAIGPTIGDLAAAVSVSTDTVGRVREEAGIVVKLRGAEARNRRYSQSEIDRMIAAAMAGTFLDRHQMAKAWAKWGSGNAADKPHESK